MVEITSLRFDLLFGAATTKHYRPFYCIFDWWSTYHTMQFVTPDNFLALLLRAYEAPRSLWSLNQQNGLVYERNAYCRVYTHMGFLYVGIGLVILE